MNDVEKSEKKLSGFRKKTLRTKVIGTAASIFVMAFCFCGMAYNSEIPPMQTETEQRASYEFANASRRDQAKYPLDGQNEPEQETEESHDVIADVNETSAPKAETTSNKTAPKPTPKVVETNKVNEPKKEVKEPVAEAVENPEPTPANDSIPLSAEMQKVLFSTCDKYGVPYEIALAVIETESKFVSTARNGSCYGYMQINTTNSKWLSSSIGVSDITDPAQNIKAGVYMLSYLYDKYDDWHPSLVAYNCGEGGANSNYFSKGVYTSSYSRTVMSRADKWGELV